MSSSLKLTVANLKSFRGLLDPRKSFKELNPENFCDKFKFRSLAEFRFLFWAVELNFASFKAGVV